MAFDLAVTGRGVGRVIARPFVGEPGPLHPDREQARFRDDAYRPRPFWIGSIAAGIAGRGHRQDSGSVRRPGYLAIGVHTASDDEGMDAVERELGATPRGLIFANLVDFDTLYGHRNDVEGYAANLERFDARLAALLPMLRDRRSADRDGRPRQRSDDAEHRPLAGARSAAGHRSAGGGDVDLGTRSTFADLGATVAETFGSGPV